MRADLLQQLQSRYGSADWSKWQPYRWQFYDYIRYPPAGTTSLSFFVNATGATDPVSGLAKTLEDTNMPSSRTFGQVFYFIQQIRCHISILPLGRQVAGISGDTDVLYTTITNAVSKWNELTRTGVLNITIGQKQYVTIEQPFMNCPPGFGLEVQQHSNHHVGGIWETYSLWPQQSQSDRDVYAVTPPQLVEPQQTLNVTIDFATTSPVFTGLVNAVDLAIQTGVIFDGYVVRPAQ